jgi:membrane protein DedA with SNARE-associated domain
MHAGPPGLGIDVSLVGTSARHPDSSMVIENLIRHYGLWAVFFGVMIEGDLSLLFAGVLAHYGLFSFGEAILTGTAGGFVGDCFSFLIGYTGKQKIRSNRFYQRAQPRLEQLSARFGLYSVFLVKYVYGLRTASAVFWGFAHMPFRRFGPLTLASCGVWALLLAGAGYFFSGAVSVLVGHVRQVSVILLIAVAIALAVAAGLYLLERYVIGPRIPEIQPLLLHDPAEVQRAAKLEKQRTKKAGKK